ncbi:MazG-like family protein [uncultured Enterococcus sp.]|uniref:MazG-like family protein n=1 Tax=uncultured Enterococcus sp. TaxID=167972 RepID=UPI002AA8793F|nr:MazG-like family protein [uncultured Enterococcus sp.]
MDIHNYQKWISDFYKERDWYRLDPFVRVSFLSEETGEVAQAVRAIEIGRDRPDEELKSPGLLKQQLTEELGDVLDNIFILADKYDIQLEDIMIAHKNKLTDRFSKE